MEFSLSLYFALTRQISVDPSVAAVAQHAASRSGKEQTPDDTPCDEPLLPDLRCRTCLSRLGRLSGRAVSPAIFQIGSEIPAMFKRAREVLFASPGKAVGAGRSFFQRFSSMPETAPTGEQADRHCALAPISTADW